MSDAHKHNGNSKDDTKQSPPLRSQNRTINRAFDLEPNPFEQSFSNNRSSTTSSNDDRQHEKDDKSKDMDSKPVLPSVAALSSPTDAYPWSDLAPNSLRSGPLSPAMLQGPQQAHQPNLNPYDPTRGFGRTGLTPSTGLTPLVGGPISFPPPSPNTAAFLAMVTNQSNSSQNTNPPTITPNTFSAITSMLNPTNNSQQGAIPPSVTTSVPTSSATASSSIPATANPNLLSQAYPYSSQNANGFSTSSSATANAAANGLFLLSQAHQELTKREEAARADANVTNRRTSKRKSMDAPAPPPVTASSTTTKRPRANSTRTKRGKSTADEDDSGDDDDNHEDMNDKLNSNGPNRKPETEEEKRRNFLERNRQAALKCRQRKKAWLAQLQARVEFLQTENERLTTALVSSREEISRLNALLGAGGPPPPGIPTVSSQPVSVAVSLPPASRNVVASQAPGPTAVVANGRGYGY